MRTEYEATFPNIDPEQIRKRLKQYNATLKKAEFLQTRCVFDLPAGREIANGWLRLRNEGDCITLTLKIVSGQAIEEQQELELYVNDFQQAKTLLTILGCHKRAYQESKRELWKLNEIAITIDTWPFLHPYVEVEGSSERAVKDICKQLLLPYEEALFCSIDKLYALQYGISPDIINRKISALTFDGENPLLPYLKG